MNVIPSLEITGSALNAERVRLDVISSNIANAQTTRDVDGKPYQRKVVSFEAAMMTAEKGNPMESSKGVRGVRVSGITQDTRPGEKIFNPAHPDADADGMVTLPNVKTAEEMIDLITSSRAYEANLTVAKNSKAMADAALRMGRQ